MPVPLAKTTSRVLSLVDISYPGGRRWVGAARYRTKRLVICDFFLETKGYLTITLVTLTVLLLVARDIIELSRVGCWNPCDVVGGPR